MKKVGFAITSLLLVFSGVLPLKLSAQETSGNAVSVNVNWVVVRVLVLENGKPVKGFAEKDFLVYEDGVPQEIQKVAVDDSLAIVFVVDQSGSMENVFEKAKDAAALVFRFLSSDDEVAIVGFDHETRTLAPFTNDRQKTAGVLSNVKNTGGGTDIIAGLLHGVKMLKGIKDSRRRAILFVSDNRESAKISAEDKILLGNEMLRNDIAMYNVKLGDAAGNTEYALPGSGEDMIRFLVKLTGGQIIDARRGNIAKAIGTAVEKLKQTYSVYYSPTNFEKTGIRKVEVKLADNPRKLRRIGGRKYAVIARKEYYLKNAEE